MQYGLSSGLFQSLHLGSIYNYFHLPFKEAFDKEIQYKEKEMVGRYIFSRDYHKQKRASK